MAIRWIWYCSVKLDGFWTSQLQRVRLKRLQCTTCFRFFVVFNFKKIEYLAYNDSISSAAFLG